MEDLYPEIPWIFLDAYDNQNVNAACIVPRLSSIVITSLRCLPVCCINFPDAFAKYEQSRWFAYQSSACLCHQSYDVSRALDLHKDNDVMLDIMPENVHEISSESLDGTASDDDWEILVPCHLQSFSIIVVLAATNLDFRQIGCVCI